MGVIEVSSHLKWEPNNSYPSFNMMSNVKNMLDIEEARAREVLNNLDSIINDLSNLKGMMGSATGLSSQISSVINTLLDYRNDFNKKNKNIINYANDIINAVITNKDEKKLDASLTSKNISDVSVRGGM